MPFFENRLFFKCLSKREDRLKGCKKIKRPMVFRRKNPSREETRKKIFPKFLKQIHAKKLSIVKKSKCGEKKDFRGEISSRERRPQ